MEISIKFYRGGKENEKKKSHDNLQDLHAIPKI